MNLDKVAFFRNTRQIFGGSLNQGQVDGITAILNAWDTSGGTDPRFLAYCLGTAKHETANTMQPIAEYGRGAGRPYGKPDAMGRTYYGRGFVQLTWLENYTKAGQKLGIDLVSNPDLAMQPATAAKILITGMTEGWFTGKKLADYFNTAVTDWVNARRIVNGTDKAALIAGYGKLFHAAILAAMVPEANQSPAVIIPAPPPPPPAPAKSATNWVAAAGAGVPGAVAAAKGVADYVNSTVSQVSDATGQVTSTITTIHDNANTVAGAVSWALSGPILIGIGLLIVVAAGVVVYRHSQLLKASA